MVLPRGPRTALAVLMSVTWMVCSPTATAQDDDTPPEAIEFYRLAREHYEGGQYRRAASELERALVLDPDSPTLVYNLARVYELLGELDQALEMYERYQRLLPQQQAREQERAASTIRRLQGAQESDELESSPSPAPAEVAPLRQLPGVVLVRENGVADAPVWVTLAGGVASLAVGATFGGLAVDTHGRAQDFVLGPDGEDDDRQALFDRSQTFGIVADVTLGVGSAAVIASALLYFLREHTVERAPVGTGDGGESGSPDVEADLAIDATRIVALARGRF